MVKNKFTDVGATPLARPAAIANCIAFRDMEILNIPFIL